MPVAKAESPPVAKSDTKPEAKASPAKAPIRKSRSIESAAPSASITDTIVEYRVKLGQHIGQSAVDQHKDGLSRTEIAGQIGDDVLTTIGLKRDELVTDKGSTLSVKSD